ncbi:MAG: hypothetical protein ABIG44_18240 [Planctomycetota bacterium]
MVPGLHVNKYQVAARVADGLVEWRFAVETEDGQQHELSIRDGEEIPVLLDIVRRDTTVHYDPVNGALSTGWNNPGH